MVWLRNAGLLFLLLVVRQWDRLAHPLLWAEDGRIYLRKAYRDGLSTFIHPSSGYFHGIQRLAAYLITAIPPTWVPFHWLINLNCLVATFVFALCASFFVDDGFEHLIASRAERFAVALCLCLAPGLDEILGNLANLHSVCAFFLFLLAIRSRDRSLTVAEGIFAGLCILTSGEGIVLVAPFAFRYWRFRRRDDLWLLAGLSASSVMVVGTALGIGAIDKGAAVAEMGSLSEVVTQTTQAWVFSFGNWIAIFPWAGYRLTSNIGGYVPVLWWSLWLGGLVMVARSFKRDSARRFEWLLWGAYFAQILFLTIYVRGRWGAQFFWRHPTMPWPELGRYGFILAPYAVLFWVLILGRGRTPGAPAEPARRAWGLKAFLSVYLLHGLFGAFVLPAFDAPHHDWAKVDAEIAAAYRTGCPRKYPLSGAPREWILEITMPERGVPCP